LLAESADDQEQKFLRHFEELIEQLGPVKFRRLADEAYDAHGNGDALPSVEETSKQEGANVASCILLLGGVQSTRNAYYPVAKERCSMCNNIRKTAANATAADQAASAFKLCVPCHMSLQDSLKQ